MFLALDHILGQNRLVDETQTMERTDQSFSNLLDLPEGSQNKAKTVNIT